MLTDFELENLRKEKKRQKQLKNSSAVRIAMRQSREKHSAKQVREALEPFISVQKAPEILMKSTVDPVEEALRKFGYIVED